jgi:DNA-binding NarL/FixJ family response regulator
VVREALVAAVERAELSGALGAELRARFLLGRSYQDHAEMEEAARWFRSGCALAARAGTPWAPYAFDCRWQLAWVLPIGGQWDEALDLVDDSQQPGPPLGHGLLQVLREAIRSARGANPDLTGLRELWEQEALVAVHDGALRLQVAADAGRPEEVLAVYDEVVAVVTPIWHEWFGARVRLAACALSGLAQCFDTLTGEQRAALLARAETLLDDGLAVQSRQERFDASRGFWGPEGQAWAQRLVAELLRLRWLAGVDAPPYDELVRAWREAVVLTEDFGDVFRTAQARVVLAGILRAGGDIEASREVADAARGAAETLGAAPLLAELRRLGATRSAQSSGAGTTELTPREREILGLVSEGASNGEIGRRLFISPKTVSVHVSHILAKLGAASRTEAAAVARRRGLLG